MRRREFLRRTAVVTGGAAMAQPSVASAASDGTAEPGPSPYGPLLEPDDNGVRLPRGFTSRVVARATQPVADTGFLWPLFPDGGHVYPARGGGWIYAVNSEVPEPPAGGGASAIRFDADGTVVAAYSILRGTQMNCAGGPTPWGTWLSCEEHEAGRVWECDPTQPSQGVARNAMGSFVHEAAAVDPRPRQRRIYLTEDVPDGGFYRFTPASYPELSAGVLEIAVVEGFAGASADAGGAVRWVEIPDPNPVVAPRVGAPGTPTRAQVADATKFNGGEGIAFDGTAMFFSTKGDNRIWRYVPTTQRIEVLYSAGDFGEDAPLRGVDNVVVGPSGDVYVAEDGGDMQIVIITTDGVVAPVVQLVGNGDTEHEGSEVAGPAFTPDGTRLYFSSQRGGPRPTPIGSGFGVTYEVTGPFLGAGVDRGGRPDRPRPRPSPSDGIANMADSARRRLPATGGGPAAVVGGGAVVGALWLRRRLGGK